MVPLQPVSVKTDLNSFYIATEALNGWRAAWAAATAAVSLQDRGSTRNTAAAVVAVPGSQRGGTGRDGKSGASPATHNFLSHSGGGTGTEGLEYHYSLQSGIEWVCKDTADWRFPLSLFVSKLPEPGLWAAPSPLFLSPLLVKRQQPLVRQEQQHQLKHQRQQRYIFRIFSIAGTCVVLSFKADTGGSTGALRRSVVTLSSLEDARFQVDGLHMSGHRLAEKLKHLQQQQPPQWKQSPSLLAELQRHHRLPALSLRDVARVVGHFYQQQLLRHLSKVLVSVDLLGRLPLASG